MLTFHTTDRYLLNGSTAQSLKNEMLPYISATQKTSLKNPLVTFVYDFYN